MIGVVELLVLFPLSVALVLAVLYWVIRLAVRHGVLDAQRAGDAYQVRGELGLGRERSPNSPG